MDDIKSTGVTIKLKQDTANRLNSLKHPGQTYDGVITELLDELKAKEPNQEVSKI